MAVWVQNVHAQAPPACLAVVYLDDRTVWGRGDQGLNALLLAMHTGNHVDRIFCFQLHPDRTVAVSRVASTQPAPASCSNENPANEKKP